MSFLPIRTQNKKTTFIQHHFPAKAEKIVAKIIK